MSKSCENCVFFQAKNKFCRRFPPQPVVIEILENGKRRDIVVSKFPVVVFPEIDYCGEFEDKEDELLEG
jgi:hypothetical protein